MAKLSRPRYGSLQYWPRKRARKAVPRVNWTTIKGGEGFLGFLTYKAGMATALVRDKTEKSMTANKKVALPVTILEVPKMKLFSVRFYKNGRVMKDVIVSNDPVLKRVVRVPEKTGSLENIQGWDAIHVIVYPVTKDLFKKAPDFAEVAVRAQDPLAFVKNHIGKEIGMHDIFKGSLIDVRGLTRGKGLVGPVKRFGISLKSHKSEKGVRRPGSLGPWHPARVTFKVPLSGQLGMFTRIQYNVPILAHGKAGEHIPASYGFKHYGPISDNHIIIAGSVQGPPKRVLLVTPSFRPTKKQAKKKYEFMELKL
ncbi:MAG: 50S ribosomal protein L3 [Nanoarchaeota archaeon]